MTTSFGFVVCKRVPAPRAQHPWTYVPISAVSFDLAKVQRCWDGLCDPKRLHLTPECDGADGFVLAQLVPVDLSKPAWPVLDAPVNARDHRVNERLADIINLDQAVTA